MSRSNRQRDCQTQGGAKSAVPAGAPDWITPELVEAVFRKAGRGTPPNPSIPPPLQEPDTRLRAGDWNQIELLLDANVIRTILNNGNQSGGVAEEVDSDAESLRELIALFKSAIALDGENLAANHQLYYLQIGRLQLRLKQYDAAWESLDRALALESLDAMATDFHRAWARVYRARVALVRGDRTAARREAGTGLALKSPALETPVAWPEAPEKRATAADALRALLKL